MFNWIKFFACAIVGSSADFGGISSFDRRSIVRHYPSDSPEARARLLALTLLADGAIDQSELRLIDDRAAMHKLGMEPEHFDRVFYEFCTDMLSSARRNESGQFELDSESIDKLLAEVDSPALRESTLRTMLDIVHADKQLAGGEAVLITQALKRWSLDLHQLSGPLSQHRPLSRHSTAGKAA